VEVGPDEPGIDDSHVDAEPLHFLGDRPRKSLHEKNIHHPFCKFCGVRSFAPGKGGPGGPMVAINTRCLDDVDATTLNIQHFDGKSL